LARFDVCVELIEAGLLLEFHALILFPGRGNVAPRKVFVESSFHRLRETEIIAELRSG
jgi:hypothetical protein